MDFNQVTSRISKSDKLEFGAILTKTFELYKKVWLQGFFTLLFGLLLIAPFYVLLYIPMIAAGVTEPDMLKSEEMSPVLGLMMMVLMPILMVAAMTTAIALNAAFLRICHHKYHNLDVQDDYFYFFKNGRWKKSLALGLIMLVMAFLGAMMCGVGIIYFVVPISLLPAFFAFAESLSPIEITKASLQLANKNWLVIFGLILLTGFIAELGIILCFVGILFTAMLSKIPMYFVYMDAMESANDTEII
ncbi:hypothetical protein [Euzebyella saccharophila]|uniref:Glycerophosphoryl diester phosphodiesterase membrane domain-containing protein n=1 Tax=Euzebyella saccharophila TaxID=679664 RepID=A0ABV8JRF9_9FLAO|nr:hypothetical protein [Euzebyella saccharophila]